MNGTTPSEEETGEESPPAGLPTPTAGHPVDDTVDEAVDEAVDETADEAVDETAEEAVEEMVDTLPEDLDRTFGSPYEFPDNKRRRIPGILYILTGVIVGGWALSAGSDAVLVNGGLLAGCGALIVIGVWHVLTAHPLKFDENEALVAATRAVGFAVGHASAQLGWRGLLSRPTWRILLYSAEDPPEQRGLVLVDAVDGSIVDQFTESNPEDWSEMLGSGSRGEGGSPEEGTPATDRAGAE